jgi:hypothetical protein
MGSGKRAVAEEVVVDDMVDDAVARKAAKKAKKAAAAAAAEAEAAVVEDAEAVALAARKAAKKAKKAAEAEAAVEVDAEAVALAARKAAKKAKKAAAAEAEAAVEEEKKPKNAAEAEAEEEDPESAALAAKKAAKKARKAAAAALPWRRKNPQPRKRRAQRSKLLQHQRRLSPRRLPQQTRKSGKTIHTNAVIAIRIGLTLPMIKRSGSTWVLLKRPSVARTAGGLKRCAWREVIQMQRQRARERKVTRNLKCLWAVCHFQQRKRFFARTSLNAVKLLGSQCLSTTKAVFEALRS